jgi:hypothetical protein
MGGAAGARIQRKKMVGRLTVGALGAVLVRVDGAALLARVAPHTLLRLAARGGAACGAGFALRLAIRPLSVVQLAIITV